MWQKEGEKMLFNNHSKKGREPQNKEIEELGDEKNKMAKSIKRNHNKITYRITYQFLSLNIIV